MLWGAASGQLELRQTENGGFRIYGAFPYGVETELAPGRAERIESRAFASRLDDAGQDIHFLSGHDYAKPLASRQAGNLFIYHDAQADAVQIAVDVKRGTSWANDFIEAYNAGLIRGLSPGFRVSPGGEKVETRGNVLLRSITRAELFEVSAVTVPAYSQAQIEARSWQAPKLTNLANHHLNRWRL